MLKMDLKKKSSLEDTNNPSKRSDVPAENDPQYVKIKKVRRSIRKIANLLSMTIAEIKIISSKHKQGEVVSHECMKNAAQLIKHIQRAAPSRYKKANKLTSKIQ